ncbi:hypothetical protein [Nonomuraea sp. NPDC003201]
MPRDVEGSVGGIDAEVVDMAHTEVGLARTAGLRRCLTTTRQGYSRHDSCGACTQPLTYTRHGREPATIY